MWPDASRPRINPRRSVPSYGGKGHMVNGDLKWCQPTLVAQQARPPPVQRASRAVPFEFSWHDGSASQTGSKRIAAASRET
eukprot:scaffold239803_cov31-Tisochrysis_lutea.AAC.1